ncbi:MAG: hypothetical protein M1308_11955 [Actinobacteria bacterium]|nr:hypothetical protein [Actinomycetota bacterium]
MNTIEHQTNFEQYKNIDNKVSWQIFIWVIGILMIIIGTAINYSLGANEKADNVVQQIGDVKGDIKAINASLNFIQGTLVEIKQEIKK